MTSDELRELALKAKEAAETDGDWIVLDDGKDCGVVRAHDDGVWVAQTGFSGYPAPAIRAAFIAAANPERVLALLDEVERKNEALRKIEGWFRDYARQHRAKGTSDGNLKADTNDERADFARTALSEGQKS